MSRSLFVVCPALLVSDGCGHQPAVVWFVYDKWRVAPHDIGGIPKQRLASPLIWHDRPLPSVVDALVRLGRAAEKEHTGGGRRALWSLLSEDAVNYEWCLRLAQEAKAAGVNLEIVEVCSAI